MATHTVHPDVHEHGLADDCPRCEELAARPLELDDEMIGLSWRIMLNVEFGEGSYRSRNEATLGGKLYEHALFTERYLNIDPRGLWGPA